MDNSASRRALQPTLEHLYAVIATTSVRAAVQAIADRARFERQLTEKAVVSALQRNAAAKQAAWDASRKVVTDWGDASVELKSVRFVPSTIDDLAVEVTTTAGTGTVPMNYKRERDPTGLKRLARHGGVYRTGTGKRRGKGQPKGEHLIRSLTDPTAGPGAGVVAAAGPLGAVTVYTYDWLAVLATTPEFNGLTDAVVVPGFDAAPYAGACAMYGAEDAVLQADHRLADAHWRALVPQLARTTCSRLTLKLGALTRYETARRAWATATVAESGEVLDVLAELRALDAVRML